MTPTKHPEQVSEQFIEVWDILEGDVKILRTGIETNHFAAFRNQHGKEKAQITFERRGKKFKITLESEDPN